MMNETIETIKARRSTRDFLDKKIPGDLMEKIIECGFFAPSSYNRQEWFFTVIENREIIDKLNTAGKKAARLSGDPNLVRMADDKNFDIFYGAPAIILISGKKTGLTPMIDAVSATQNMLLAAESLGLGTCWNGIIKWLFESETSNIYKDMLNISDVYQPYHAIAIGYKVREYATYPRRDFTKVNYIR